VEVIAIVLGVWAGNARLLGRQNTSCARRRIRRPLSIALLVAAAGVRITLFVHSALFSYAITVVWILTVTNALNFMDNMNGLWRRLGAIGAGWFAIIAAAAGNTWSR